MNFNKFKSFILNILTRTPLQYFQVKVRKGVAKGAKWTLLPMSAYWRLGGHEPEMELAINSVGDIKGETCYDLGAHFGIYTIGMAILVGENGQVVAFEPDPKIFLTLQTSY